eukprot:Skav223743  [mRNA]  locus=scaffold3575:90547:96702:- [translate_table: standard]
MDSYKTRADSMMTFPEESMPMLTLTGMPSHHRHVYLTAEVLVTMRQALDSPAISTDDHLKFQGLDASAGAQLMEVLGAEIEHRLPLDWPNQHGTVAALAQQLGSHVMEVKKVGYLMRDQYKIMDSVLGLQDEESTKKGEGVRQGRFVLMTDRLFDMADRAPHDHCALPEPQSHSQHCDVRSGNVLGKCAENRKATLTLQRVWQGALMRQWIRQLNEAAVDIQRRGWRLKFARGLLVRVSLDRFGRELLRKSQAELTQLMKRREELGEGAQALPAGLVVGWLAGWLDGWSRS